MRGIPKRKHAIFVSARRLQNRYTKEEHLLKSPLGHTPTIPVMAENLREEKLPLQTNPRRASLASARKTMQAI